MLPEPRETMPRNRPSTWTLRSVRAAQITVLAALALACRSDRPGVTTRPAADPGRSPAPSPAAAPGRSPAPSPARSPDIQEPADRGDPGREDPPPADRGGPRGDPESGRLAGITAAHNRVREGVGVGPLEWSPELARYAQRWADKLKQRGCGLDHRPSEGPDAQRHGENLFSGTGYAPTAVEVVESWAGEVAHYDAKRNRCKGICGHYTQIVWRSSQRLGCAMAACGDTEVWVCNYDPPGNYIGKRPY